MAEGYDAGKQDNVPFVLFTSNFPHFQNRQTVLEWRYKAREASHVTKLKQKKK